MDNTAFTAGVNPGGLTTSTEIKILICYLLSTVEEPLSGEMIKEVLFEEGIANYFECADAIADLSENGNLHKTGEEGGIPFYRVTERGRKNAGMLMHSVPRSARDKAVQCALRLLGERRKNAQNKVEIKKAPDGYTVSCRVLDVGSDLMNLTLFVADKVQAERVKEVFLADPSRTYRYVLAYLSGDEALTRALLCQE